MRIFPGETPHTPAAWSEAVRRLARSDRVLLVGPSGAGKSHLAIQLAPILHLGVQHLDAHFWEPGWRVAKPPSAWRAVVEGLVREPRWIMDGTYERTLSLRIPAAECVIVVERSRTHCLWRAFWRTVRARRAPRVDAPPGERFTGAFVRYIWRYPVDTRPLIAEALKDYGAGKTIIVLRTRADTSRLLRDLSEVQHPMVEVI